MIHQLTGKFRGSSLAPQEDDTASSATNEQKRPNVTRFGGTQKGPGHRLTRIRCPRVLEG